MYAQKMPILILPRREENTTEADHITELNQWCVSWAKIKEGSHCFGSLGLIGETPTQRRSVRWFKRLFAVGTSFGDFAALATKHPVTRRGGLGINWPS
jgi:hypothetical protein